MSDGYLKTSSVGALAVSDSDPNVIYAGMGESTIRADVSHGNGVYKSTDRAGAGCISASPTPGTSARSASIHATPTACTWPRSGTPSAPTRNAACTAPPTGERAGNGCCTRTSATGGPRLPGVTGRGRRTSPSTPAIRPSSTRACGGCTRNFWELASGGPGSGLWRSTDSGTTWTEITPNLGLPASTVLGKIGVAASPARSGRVWALVESDTAPGLYRSDDFGETWTLARRPPGTALPPLVLHARLRGPTGRGHRLRQQPADVEVHRRGGALHTGPDTARRQPRSVDRSARQPAHDPGQRRRGQRFVQRRRLLELRLQPAHRAALHGGHRRSRPPTTSSTAPSRTTPASACLRAPTTAPSPGRTAASPAPARAATWRWIRGTPDVVYVGAVGSSPGGGGALQRYDHRTGQIRLVNVWPEHHGGIGPGELKYRFGWTFPIRFSPHDPERALHRGNRVFRSTDEGQSWGADQPRPHPRGGRQARPLGRADHPGHQRGGALLHPVHTRRIAPRAGRAVGGVRRRPGASQPRRGAKLARRDAAGSPRVGRSSAPSSPRCTRPARSTSPPPATSSTIPLLTSTRPQITGSAGRRSPARATSRSPPMTSPV